MIGWLERAACRGLPTELFFDAPVADAVKVCRSCAVIDVCAEVARATKTSYGVWGGVDREQPSKARKSA